MDNQIEKAIKILNQGGIVIFPTDTAFGIGCRIDDENAIERLFKIRKRPVFQATPVLFSDLEMVKKYVLEIPNDVKEKLIDKFWPGALTIVLEAKKDNVPSLVRGGKDNIGIRIPNNKIILEIIRSAGVPILGPSANFHGQNTPYEFKDLNSDLIKLVDFVVNGKCELKKPSTVIDCTKISWEILRQGALKVNI